MATITGNNVKISGGGSTSPVVYGQLEYSVSALDPVTNTVTISGIKPHFRFSGGGGVMNVKRVSFKFYVGGSLKQTWGAYTYSTDGNAHNYSTTFNNVTVTNPNTSGAGFSFTISFQCAIDILSGSTSLQTGTSSASATISVSGVTRASTFTMGSNSVDIGSSQSLTITQYITGASHTWSYSFLNTTGTPSVVSNAWTIPTSFEDLMTTITSGSCALTLTTIVDGNTIGSTTKTFTITVPSSYVPVITLGTLTKTNAYSGQLFAGYSSFTQAYTLSMTPSGNSATIDSITCSMTNGTAASCTTTATTSNVMPSSVSDYTCTLTLVVTDTRGRTATKNVNIGTIKAIVSPAVSINSLGRCTSAGVLDPAGTYAKIEVSATSDYAISSVKCVANGTTYNLSLSGGFYQGVVGNGTLNINAQYTITANVLDAVAQNYSIPATSVSQILPTMSMPISLFDDGTDVGVTIGRIATEDGFNVYLDAVFNGTISGTHVGDQVRFTVSGGTLNIVDVS